MLTTDQQVRQLRRLDAEGAPAAVAALRSGMDAKTARKYRRLGRLPSEVSCLSLVWAVLDRASRGWRGFTMTSDGTRQLQDLRRALLEPPTQLHPRTTADSPSIDSVGAVA